MVEDAVEYLGLPVNKALTFYTFYGGYCSVNFTIAEARPVILSKIEFGQVTMKVLLTPVLVHAAHSTLESRKQILECVDTRAASDEILIGFVLQTRLAGDVVSRDGADRELVCGPATEGAHVAAALHKCDDGMFGHDAGFCQPTKSIGWVAMGRNAEQAGQCRAIATHGFTNAVAHEPCRFVTEVKGEMKLMSTDAVRRHHVEGHEPFIERDMSPLHDGAGGHGEILAAFLFSATIPAGLIGLVSVVDGAAMRAYWPFGPANLFQPFAG